MKVEDCTQPYSPSQHWWVWEGLESLEETPPPQIRREIQPLEWVGGKLPMDGVKKGNLWIGLEETTTWWGGEMLWRLDETT